MDTLDWTNASAVRAAKDFFDAYITAWNPRPIQNRAVGINYSSLQDPCLLQTHEILTGNQLQDYE